VRKVTLPNGYRIWAKRWLFSRGNNGDDKSSLKKSAKHRGKMGARVLRYGAATAGAYAFDLTPA
jgi:hypothetical protein